jgi:DNA-directed RNA polymerase subunit M/transcription elongation factor TFIIS
MFYLKACEKCKGDLFLDRDSYGSFLKCLQCGRLVEVEEHGSELVKLAAGEQKKVAA